MEGMQQQPKPKVELENRLKEIKDRLAQKEADSGFGPDEKVIPNAETNRLMAERDRIEKQLQMP